MHNEALFSGEFTVKVELLVNMMKNTIEYTWVLLVHIGVCVSVQLLFLHTVVCGDPLTYSLLRKSPCKN